VPLPTHVGLNRNRTNACYRPVLSGRETRTCHKEPIEFSIYPVYQLLTRHTEKRNTRGARKPSRLCASWLRFAISWRRSVEEGKREFRRTEGGDEQKTESRPISVWSPELRDGLGKPTEVAGLLPRSEDKRTGGKTNRIRKEFLPVGEI